MLGGESATAEIGSYNNFPKLLEEVDYEFKNVTSAKSYLCP